MANPLDELKQFLADHPELVPAVMAAGAEVLHGPPTPLTIEGVLHDLVDAFAQRAPVDAERVAQMHDVVSAHYSPGAAAAAAEPSSAPSSAPSADPASFDPPGA